MTKEASARMGEALLRTCGGWDANLRWPLPPVAGDAGEELGLASPTFQEIALGPATFRKLGKTNVMLVSAAAVDVAAGEAGVRDAITLLESGAGIAVNGIAYRVVDVAAEEWNGSAACYAVTVQPMEEGV